MQMLGRGVPQNIAQTEQRGGARAVCPWRPGPAPTPRAHDAQTRRAYRKAGSVIGPYPTFSSVRSRTFEQFGLFVHVRAPKRRSARAALRGLFRASVRAALPFRFGCSVPSTARRCIFFVEVQVLGRSGGRVLLDRVLYSSARARWDRTRRSPRRRQRSRRCSGQRAD
jgi:hypothetical protein